MPVRRGVGRRIVVVVASSAHFGRRDRALVAVQRLEHLLQRSRIHVHVFGALGFVALAAGDLMFVHDILVVVLRARSRSGRD